MRVTAQEFNDTEKYDTAYGEHFFLFDAARHSRTCPRGPCVETRELLFTSLSRMHSIPLDTTL